MTTTISAIMIKNQVPVSSVDGRRLVPKKASMTLAGKSIVEAMARTFMMSFCRREIWET